MTCEVAILNKRGLVLAADSAGTVTRWHNGQKDVRYFKGENKIFQLSYYHPVGVMTYANANLDTTPWEIIIKEFRLTLGQTDQVNLEKYADELFSFVSNRLDLVPEEQRKESLEDKLTSSSLKVYAEALNNANIESGDDDAAKAAKIETAIDGKLQQLISEFRDGLITSSEVGLFHNEHASKATALLTKHPIYQGASNNTVSKLILAGAYNLGIRYGQFSEHSGLVLSGYGSGDIFPRLISYRVHGFIGSRLVHEKLKDECVSGINASVVESFALSDMTDTFFSGASSSLYGVVNESFVNTAIPLVSDLLQQPVNALPQSVIDKVFKAQSDFSKDWFGNVLEENYLPFRSVVGNLPIDEMANLGETLISLEALKERVTRPTESVGGPVDVASITKHEGFIWIKRKHYFDLEKNPRYWQRLGGTQNG